MLMQKKARACVNRHSMLRASNKRIYAIKKPRAIRIDTQISKLVQEVGSSRPTYGTRRMVAILSCMSNRPVNHKKCRKYTHILTGAYMKSPKKRSYATENDPNLQDLIISGKLT